MIEIELDRLIAAHRYCTDNRGQLDASKVAGCFYCLETFSPREITEWIWEEGTAMCPKCGIDAVLASQTGLPVTERAFLKAMRQHWFER
jgi:hypothetical protein